MCQFKSVIILKDRIYISEENSHTALLEELGIKDSLANAQTLFVRAELIPYTQDYTLDGIADWRFNVDQDIIPKWFVKDYEKNRTVKALIEYFRTDEELQLTVIAQKGYVLRYIKNPSEEVKLAAVKRDGYTLKYIKNPSDAVKLEAVKQDGYTINRIKNPSEEVQLEAVKQNRRVICFIKNPSQAVVDYLKGEQNVSI